MRVFITAGDPSADAHAARLMEQIRLRVPEVVFEGFGGPKMEFQGLRSVARLEDLAVSGFWEVAKRYGYFRKLLERCKGLLETRKPDVFIPVDYPGFNIRLARHAKKLNIPVTWYIAPQLWAWGKNRSAKLAQAVDLLMVVFPFEVEFFQNYGIKTVHVGHPLLDYSDITSYSGGPTDPIIMMAGSRYQELRHHVPILANTIRELRNRGIENAVVVPHPSNIAPELLKPLTSLGATLSTNARQDMTSAAAGAVKAGTSTQEAALIGLPFLTYYKTSVISYYLSKHLISVDTITMSNLLLKRPVVSEFIQGDATGLRMAAEIQNLIQNEERRMQIGQATAELREVLGGPGAAVRAANEVVKHLRIT